MATLGRKLLPSTVNRPRSGEQSASSATTATRCPALSLPQRCCARDVDALDGLELGQVVVVRRSGGATCCFWVGERTSGGPVGGYAYALSYEIGRRVDTFTSHTVVQLSVTAIIGRR